MRAIYSDRQLEEVMTDFWFNHFNVFIGKGADRFLVTGYERDVIRPHVLGQVRRPVGCDGKESGNVVLSRQLDERGAELARGERRSVTANETVRSLPPAVSRSFPTATSLSKCTQQAQSRTE